MVIQMSFGSPVSDYLYLPFLVCLVRMHHGLKEVQPSMICPKPFTFGICIKGDYIIKLNWLINHTLTWHCLNASRCYNQFSIDFYSFSRLGSSLSGVKMVCPLFYLFC